MAELYGTGAAAAPTPADSDSSVGYDDAATTDLPAYLRCPITQLAFEDPVVTPGGQTYERAAVKEWLRHNAVDPVTRETLSADALVPNRSVRDSVRGFRALRAALRSAIARSQAAAAQAARAADGARRRDRWVRARRNELMAVDDLAQLEIVGVGGVLPSGTTMLCRAQGGGGDALGLRLPFGTCTAPPVMAVAGVVASLHAERTVLTRVPEHDNIVALLGVLPASRVPAALMRRAPPAVRDAMAPRNGRTGRRESAAAPALVLEHHAVTLGEHCRGGLAPAEIVRVAAQLADAVLHLHEHGVVHMDLSLHTVMVDTVGGERDDGGSGGGGGRSSSEVGFCSENDQSGICGTGLSDSEVHDQGRRRRRRRRPHSCCNSRGSSSSSSSGGGGGNNATGNSNSDSSSTSSKHATASRVVVSGFGSARWRGDGAGELDAQLSLRVLGGSGVRLGGNRRHRAPEVLAAEARLRAAGQTRSGDNDAVENLDDSCGDDDDGVAVVVPLARQSAFALGVLLFEVAVGRHPIPGHGSDEGSGGGGCGGGGLGVAAAAADERDWSGTIDWAALTDVAGEEFATTTRELLAHEPHKRLGLRPATQRLRQLRCRLCVDAGTDGGSGGGGARATPGKKASTRAKRHGPAAAGVVAGAGADTTPDRKRGKREAGKPARGDVVVSLRVRRRKGGSDGGAADGDADGNVLGPGLEAGDVLDVVLPGDGSRVVLGRDRAAAGGLARYAEVRHRLVSALHAELWAAPVGIPDAPGVGAVVMIADLGSSNGTRVGGRQLPAHRPTRVPTGAVVRLSTLALTLERVSWAQQQPPATP